MLACHISCHASIWIYLQCSIVLLMSALIYILFWNYNIYTYSPHFIKITCWYMSHSTRFNLINHVVTKLDTCATIPCISYICLSKVHNLELNLIIILVDKFSPRKNYMQTYSLCPQHNLINFLSHNFHCFLQRWEDAPPIKSF